MTTFIDERKRFFFVHVPKTGGMTVTHHFSSGSNRDWRLELSLMNEGIGIHDGVQKIQQRLGRGMEDYFSFAFYRNTWDWYFSLYRYIQRTPRHPVFERTAGLTFREFCLQEAEVFYRPQKPLVTLNGQQAVTRLIEFSDFPAEFPRILRSLGYSVGHIESLNVAPKAAYRANYDDETRELIGRVYAEDIEYFGFTY